jgi:hypothetical protein
MHQDKEIDYQTTIYRVLNVCFQDAKLKTLNINLFNQNSVINKSKYKRTTHFNRNHIIWYKDICNEIQYFWPYVIKDFYYDDIS